MHLGVYVWDVTTEDLYNLVKKHYFSSFRTVLIDKFLLQRKFFLMDNLPCQEYNREKRRGPTPNLLHSLRCFHSPDKL